MRPLVRFWLSTTDPVDRRTYLRHGVFLAIIKYAGDAAIIGLATGRVWTPAGYLQSVDMLWSTLGGVAPWWLLPALTLWTLPFLWIGVTLTMRRCKDAGWTAWVSLGFFVPYANYVLMMALCVVPGRERPATPRTRGVPADAHLPSALMAGLVATAIGWGMLVIGAQMWRAYGIALFFGVPFVVGAIGSFIFNRNQSQSTRDTVLMTLAVVTVVGVLLIGQRMEGLICVLMALPIVIPVALLGAAMGRSIASYDDHPPRTTMFAIVWLPLWLALEPSHATGRVLHEVQTSVEVNAAPDRVWPHVVAFAPMAEPRDLVFRAGIAYPKYARIDGEGIGAVRYCVFSTGAFVEPITAWEPGRRLAFDVTTSPPPLRELSPYADVAPPHLDNYLRSRRGEFRLIALAGNRTRLEGRTWYELEMAPEGYWQLISDALIHRIHRRVLEHIAREVEGDAARSPS